MSYDVYIGDWWGNNTYNHGAMFSEAFGYPMHLDERGRWTTSGDRWSLRPLHGAPAVEAAAVIARAAARMRADMPHFHEIARNCPAYFDRVPWCIPEVVAQFLEDMAQACIDNPDAIIEVG